MGVLSKIKGLIPGSLKRTYHQTLFGISSALNSNPDSKLKLIGVTGTSGKSTTAEMIYHVLSGSGVKVGVISTIGAKTGTHTVSTGLHVTTPDPFDIPKLLAKLRGFGAEYVVLECSSHALEQGRLGNLKFDLAVYTNITRDHLDWHKTWENYARAKARLIDALKPGKTVILNLDDQTSYNYLQRYIQSHRPDLIVLHYSSNDVFDVAVAPNGISFKYKSEDVSIPIIGEYNILNALAAIKIAETLGVQTETAVKTLKTFKTLPGRMEVLLEKPFTIIVDFAHNADSLEKALVEARKLAGNPSQGSGLARKTGRVISVFGSAGLRDKEKRGTMGEVSGRLADITVVTAEDPRTESLYTINTEIINGAESAGAKLVKRFASTNEYRKYKLTLKDTDIPAKSIFAFDETSVQGRFDAIDLAATAAKKGDIVITEGKGHEQSLCFGTKEYPYTDQEAVQKALQALHLISKSS